MRTDKKPPVFNNELLKDLRIKKGLSVKKLQDLSGVDGAHIHRMEKGIQVRPSFDTVAALAFILGESTDRFINPGAI